MQHRKEENEGEGSLSTAAAAEDCYFAVAEYTRHSSAAAAAAEGEMEEVANDVDEEAVFLL